MDQTCPLAKTHPPCVSDFVDHQCWGDCCDEDFPSSEETPETQTPMTSEKKRERQMPRPRMLRPLRLISRSKNLKANGYKTNCLCSWQISKYIEVNVDSTWVFRSEVDEVVVKTILAAIPELRNLLVPLACLKLLSCSDLFNFVAVEVSSQLPGL